MSRLTMVSISLVVMTACAGPAPTVVSDAAPKSPETGRAPLEYTIAKQIRYSFTVRNTTNRLLTNAEFVTFVPVPKTSHQWLEKLTVTQPYRLARDSLGNEMLYIGFQQLPPYATKIVSITADLKMTERPATAAATDNERFTRPERYIESNDAKLVGLARTLQDSSSLRTIKKSYDWVATNIHSEAYIPEDRGAMYALTERKGDCTEFAYLLAALGRANAIPARAIGGYVFKGNGIVKAVDYHNWTEFLADGGWQIADAQKKSFTENQIDYIAMRVISTGSIDSSSANLSAGFNRYDITPNGVEVSMN